MLIFLALLPTLSALWPGAGDPPHPGTALDAFITLYAKCPMKQFMPLSTATAEVSTISMKTTTMLTVNTFFGVDFRNSQVSPDLYEDREGISAAGLCSLDNTRCGYFKTMGEDHVFYWNNELEDSAINLGRVVGSYHGFLTADYVYTQVVQEDGARKFARWKVDLSGEVEILGDASPEDYVLLFQYAFGPAYYLTDNKCLQIDDLAQLSEGYQSFRECDTSQGMFAFSDFYAWYSLSAFAWLARECDDEIWSNYWAHVFVKFRYMPGEPSYVQRTTTPTTPTTPTITQETTTTTWTTTTTQTTTVQTTQLPTETSHVNVTGPPQPVCLIRSTTRSYAIAISTLAALCIVVGIACGAFCFFVGRRYQKRTGQGFPQNVLSNRKDMVGSKASAYITSAIGNSTKISRMETMAPLSSMGLPTDSASKNLLSPEIEKIFDKNEVEGMEAELPKSPLERPPEPPEGFFFTFGKIGLTIPAKTFDKTFGEFEMEMGGEVCAVQYEDGKGELNRIEAMAAVMRQAKACQKNGTIPEFILTVHLDNCNFRLLMMKRLGPSIQKQVLNGSMSTEERLNVVSMTFNCMQDLLFSNIIHRDIKPSSFHYDFVGSRILISNLGLARIAPKSARRKVPFFGNITFCSPSAHLGLERGHFDDMISYFYVIMALFNKDLLIWSGEADKTVVYQLKSDIMEGKVFDDRLEKFIQHPKIRDFLSQLFRLILQLPAKRPSYRQIKELIETNKGALNEGKSDLK